MYIRNLHQLLSRNPLSISELSVCTEGFGSLDLALAVVVRLQSEHQLKYHLPGGSSFTRVGQISYWIWNELNFWAIVDFWVVWRTGYMRLASLSILLYCGLGVRRVRISSMA